MKSANILRIVLYHSHTLVVNRLPILWLVLRSHRRAPLPPDELARCAPPSVSGPDDRQGSVGLSGRGRWLAGTEAWGRARSPPSLSTGPSASGGSRSCPARPRTSTSGEWALIQAQHPLAAFELAKRA